LKRTQHFIAVRDVGVPADEEDKPPSSCFSGLLEKEPELDCKSPFPLSSQSLRMLENFFPGTTLDQWNNWEWQVRNSFKDLKGLRKVISLSGEELQAFRIYRSHLPLRITPYYAGLLDPANPLQPLRRCVIPVMAEQLAAPWESIDPLGESTHCRVPGVIHRYPDRVLFLVTNFCSSYCRYCTRSRLVGGQQNDFGHPTQWEEAFSYIQSNPDIRDVLLSGGDPLTLSDNNIRYLLTRLKQISHVEIVRIGTKVPVVLPQRITPELVGVLKEFPPLWMSIHFTHPDEITPETTTACERLVEAGIPLGSQTVLLKGINDSVETMKKLVHRLLQIRVRPYYLYQCDPIAGSSHFRTPVEKGLEIIRGLRGHTSGYAVPHYVIDAPGGGGKIPLLPEYYVGREGSEVLLKNYEGKLYRYPDVTLEPESAPGLEEPPKFRIGLTYDLREDYLHEGYSEEETAEFDRPDTIAAIENALVRLGYYPERIGNIKQLVKKLGTKNRKPWDLVFNICEGMWGMGREAQVPGLLDAYEIPYTFSDSVVLALTLDKALTKQVIRDLGLPTPDFLLVRTMDDLSRLKLEFPLFAKPVGEGTGKGIGPQSKCNSMVELAAVCQELLTRFKEPVLVETYLPGREFTVGIVGTGDEAEAVGMIEVVLKDNAEAHAYSYKNKENCEELVLYSSVDGDIAEKCRELAVKAWKGLGCRDAGRIDLRLDAQGTPNFLEVNPLAELHPQHSDLPIICSTVGISYDELMSSIIKSALKRLPAAATNVQGNQLRQGEMNRNRN
jgi:lysine 2,3-aminomutase